LDANGDRMPVVGFIGNPPNWSDDMLSLENKLLGVGVQFGLKPDVFIALTRRPTSLKKF
jgi:hypothetical protein